jgi:endonuclease/exonuclease/phosphatase (EEP) superfamily protein YafD
MISLTPLVLVAAVLVAMLGVITRAAWPVLLLAAFGVMAPLGAIAPDLMAAIFRGPAAATTAPRLTILTANLWSANLDAAPIEALIRREQPDLIVLEEVYGPWNALLARLAPGYRVLAPDQIAGDPNVAILSKFRRIRSFPDQSGEMRAVLLELPERLGGGPIEVMGVHSGHPVDRAATFTDVAPLAKIAAGFGPRGIIAGDFNATPWSYALRRLDGLLPLPRRTHLVFSWPTQARSFTVLGLRLPAVAPIDHVYAGRDWRLVEVRRGPDIGSDHYPVIVTLALAQ